MTAWQEAALARHRSGTADILVVLVHGLGGSGAALCGVAAAAAEALETVDTYTPGLSYGGWGLLRPTSPAQVVCRLTSEIDALDADRAARLGESYRRIVLIGYSLGALVVRKVAIVAHGEIDGARFEPGYEACVAPRAWAPRIERIVMLGGVSKGWAIRSANSWRLGATWSVATFLLTCSPWHQDCFVLATRMGMPFPVQTRLQWLALRREQGRVLPVVQLLGSRDDVVSPDDMIDVAVDDNGTHVLLDVPATDHRAAVRMDGSADAHARTEMLKEAVTASPQDLARSKHAISSALVADGAAPTQDDRITDVVFVVHGIRDKGFWTQKVARAIKRHAARHPKGGKPRHVRSMTQSYGYLAILPFVWPGVRRMKTAWLMDRYVEARALYPEARFAFVGHSNGTYLGARGLFAYPAVKFDRVVFAGSVVRRNFDWEVLIKQPREQVQSVLNYIASGDLVVGIFPAALGFADLGGAGHAGFSKLGERPAPADLGRIATTTIDGHESYQINYVRGGHGAGVVETQWDEIAHFVVTGEAPGAVNADYVGRQTRLARVAGAQPYLTLGLLLLAYAAVVYALWHHPLALAALVAATLVVLLRL